MSCARTFSAAMIRSPSFSRFSSSTMMTIFPARISSMMSSMLLKVAADGCIEVLLCITMCPEKIPCNALRRVGRLGGTGAKQTFEVARDQVHLDVHLGTAVVSSRNRRRFRMWNDRYFEPRRRIARYLVDGKADAIDANRSLLHDISEILGRDADAQA